MSNFKESQKCIMCFTTNARFKILCPNATVQNSPWERYTRSYIIFIWICIIKSITDSHTFSSCTLIDSYNSTYKDVVAPDYLSGYMISRQATNYTTAFQKDSTRHYTLLHNPRILHTKTFFAPLCCLHKKISSDKNCHRFRLYTNARITRHRPLHNTIQTQIWVKNFPFSLL